MANDLKGSTFLNIVFYTFITFPYICELTCNAECDIHCIQGAMFHGLFLVVIVLILISVFNWLKYNLINIKFVCQIFANSPTMHIRRVHQYRTAIISTGLEKLSTRRAARCLAFSLKCIAHKDNTIFFPKKSKHFK